MIRPLRLAPALALTGSLIAQTQDPPETEAPPAQDRVLITASRGPRDPLLTPYTGSMLTEEAMRRRQYRTLPQTLRDTPGIMVQETAHGHGSPYIRGFTSFRTLLLVDGIRVNHSAFRPGPNQYWNTVDSSSLERVEIVKGPSSVQYGSDAIGGTVNAITRSPYVFGNEPGLAYGGTTRLRFSDAENSLIGRAELSLGYTSEDGVRTGVLLGGTIKRFGDLEGGDGVGEQIDTGYDDDDYDIKVEHFLGDDERLVFLHHRVMQSDVPRTHRTTSGIAWRGLSVGSDQKREFDQERRLTYLQYHRENIGGSVDSLRASLSWHEHDEIRERIRGSGAQEFQGFEVGQIGAFLQAESPSDFGLWSYGVEYYHDNVRSFFRDATPSAAELIQGPVADDATYDMLGVYLQNEYEATDRLAITLGGRFNWVAADADSVRDPVTDTQISIDEDWSKFVGSARFRYALAEDHTVQLFGGVSQGFRAPNLSDISRFDSARSNEFEIPAPGLDPEDYIEYEIGVKARTEDANVQASYYYIDIEDQILRFPTGVTNTDGDSQVTKANVGDGYVNGVELAGAYRVYEGVEAFGNFTWIEGEVENFPSAGSPAEDTYLTRLMPLTIQLGARYEDLEGRFWTEASVIRAEDADKLSFSDQRDTTRVPPGGTPSYTVLHLRGGWQISERTALTVLLENVTDEDYRVHGSGLNRPGRNFVFAMETIF